MVTDGSLSFGVSRGSGRKNHKGEGLVIDKLFPFGIDRGDGRRTMTEGEGTKDHDSSWLVTVIRGWRGKSSSGGIIREGLAEAL